MKRFAILLCLCALALLNGIDFDLVAQERTDDPSAADLPEEQAQERVRTDNEIVVPVDLRLTPPRTLDLVFVDAVSDKPAGSPVSLEPLRGRRATKEAVIDIAYVFQKLPEFARMRKDIQKKAAGHQKVMMVTAEAIRAAQKQLKTSPDAENQGLENELRALMTRMEVSKQLQRDALKKQESQMFLTVFKKIRGAIADHAKENGIHIVRRTSSQRGQLERMEAGDPQAILIAMNEQVLYVADDGIDITDEVLARLLQSDKPQK